MVKGSVEGMGLVEEGRKEVDCRRDPPHLILPAFSHRVPLLSKEPYNSKQWNAESLVSDPHSHPYPVKDKVLVI